MTSLSVTHILTLAFALTLGQAALAQPFAIQVIDESNHRGIPMATVVTDNHIRLLTDSAGWAMFDEPGLMGKTLRVMVSSPGYQLPKDVDGRAGATLAMAPNQSVEIKMVRTAIAERFYRVTGQGAYRESTLLGKETPVPFPNINGDVLNLGKAQAAIYQGKLVWIASNVGLTAPNTGLQVVGAAVDLPGTGGLDPTQGVHLRYFTNEQEETLNLLAAPKGQRTLIEGLVSVKDLTGTEHLLAHYAFVNEAGKIAEQGIAEFTAQHLFERKVVLGDEYTWQFPVGNAVEVKTDDAAFIYFAAPFCHTRVPAKYESAMSPTSYEALAWSDDAKKYVWQQERAPMTQREESRLLDRQKLKRKDARYQLVNHATEKALLITEGSAQWNAFRQCWVLIGTISDAEATPGDVWYAEATDVTGPWNNAVLIATHGNQALSGISQLPALEQESGRYIYFAGTLASNGANSEPLPRYEGNQLMYRLDLNDQRLSPGHHE